MDKAKTAESRLEEDRRQLLRGLDDAETRYTQAEVSRRRLEGELHRMQTAMNDLETEKQVNQIPLCFWKQISHLLDVWLCSLNIQMTK